jgi:hypothetical protein
VQRVSRSSGPAKATNAASLGERPRNQRCFPLYERDIGGLAVKVAALALTLMATPAPAAPICLNRAGDPVHCEAHGAMPLGWTLPPQEAEAHKAAHPGPPATEVWKTVGLLALLFALIALMPPFDGRRDQDWQ